MGGWLQWSGRIRRRHVLSRPAELCAIAPAAVHDHRQPAGRCDNRFGQAAPLGDVHRTLSAMTSFFTRQQHLQPYLCRLVAAKSRIRDAPPTTMTKVTVEASQPDHCSCHVRCGVPEPLWFYSLCVRSKSTRDRVEPSSPAGRSNATRLRPKQYRQARSSCRGGLPKRRGSA